MFETDVKETFQNAIAVDNFNKDISDIYKSNTSNKSSHGVMKMSCIPIPVVLRNSNLTHIEDHQ